MMNQRYGKKLRIHRRKELSELFRRGRRCGDDRLTLIGRATGLAGRTVRGSVAVSKRHGNAVQRNRIKRVCREAFRLSRSELPDGFDFVMIPRPGRVADLAGLRESLLALAGRVEQLTRKTNEQNGKRLP